MEFPELALRASRFSGFSGLLGVGVNRVQRKVAVNHTDLFGVGVCQTRKGGGKRPTPRSLEVAVFDDGNQGVGDAGRDSFGPIGGTDLGGFGGSLGNNNWPCAAAI